MGVAVSSWPLARCGHGCGWTKWELCPYGALMSVFAARLQLGDPGGGSRQPLAAFPYPAMAKLNSWTPFTSPAASHPTSFSPLSIAEPHSLDEQLELLVAANFVEVYLAKVVTTGRWGSTSLEKIQTPLLPSLLMCDVGRRRLRLNGAGIPRDPRDSDRLSDGQPCTMRLDIAQSQQEQGFEMRFDRCEFTE